MEGFGATQLTQSQKAEFMERFKIETALVNAQELISKISHNCFKKCVDKPGASLDNYEQKCVAMCMDRYMESWNLVSKSYMNKLKRM